MTSHDRQAIFPQPGSELEIIFQARHYDTQLTARDDGIDPVFDLILDTYRAGRRGRPPQAYVWPAISPRPEYPDNVLRFDLDVTSGTGAMMYTAARATHNGTWITRGTVTEPNKWLSFDDDIGADGRYPSGATVRIGLIREAIRELYASGGDRPSCVDWHQLPSAIW